MSTLLTLWIICGVVSAIWHVMDELWQHKVMGHELSFTLIFNFFFAALALVLGPIGLAIKIWEK